MHSSTAATAADAPAAKAASAPEESKKKTSAISGFFKRSCAERLDYAQEFGGLDDEERAAMGGFGVLGEDTTRCMVENAVGTFPLPLGIATNFQVNGKEYLVPMALEEPSVIAACSNMAKGTRSTGGMTASADEPIMIAQVQILSCADPFEAKRNILANAAEIIQMANIGHRRTKCKGVEVRVLDAPSGPMVITHLLVNCGDSMGANVVNSMAECVAPRLETISGGRACLRILSNLAAHRLCRADATWPKETLGGEEVVDGIISAYEFACTDVFRVATHNKGVMNGIDPVVIATGNDWRAIEAGCHTYAAWREGHSSFTHWEKTANGDLHGSIELPMQLGLVGGATKTHPTARAAVKLLGLDMPGGTGELGQLVCAVGLCQNLGALKALSTEGIQRGHMGLHARSLAVTVGAKGTEVDAIVETMKTRGPASVRAEIASALLADLRAQGEDKDYSMAPP